MPVLISGILYGVSLYLNPIHIMLLPAVFISLDYKDSRKGISFIIVFLLMTILTVTGLIFYSQYLTGSWVNLF